MLRFMIIISLICFAFAAPTVENEYEISIHVDYINLLQDLPNTGASYIRLNIETEENKTTAVLHANKRQSSVIIDYLKQHDVTYDIKELSEKGTTNVLNAGFVKKLISKSWKTIYLSVYLKTQVTNHYDNITNRTGVLTIGYVFENDYNVFTLMVEENSYVSLENYLRVNEIKYERIKGSSKWFRCVGDAFDEIFLQRKRKYVFAELKYQDKMGMEDFIDKYEDDKDVEILNLNLDVISGSIYIRVRYNMWPAVEKFLDDGNVRYKIKDVGAKDCN